jgi:hypothetical protein
MRNLKRTSTVLAVLVGACGALALSGVGCGGDDNNSNGDGGDSSADQSSDHTKVDQHSPDGGSDVDSAPPMDGPAETTMDSPVDSPTDSPMDAPTDSAALFAFPNQVNTAICQRLAFCCDGTDAGAFQINECIHDYVLGGGFFNVSQAQVDSGHITLDPTLAAKCLADIAGLSCGSLGNPAYKTALGDCVSAMQGHVGLGDGPCATYWDCAAGGYCAPGTDGGKSQCTAVGAVGTACKDIAYGTDCSYRGSGAPENYCSAAGTCQADLVDGVSCDSNSQCQSQICDVTTIECQESTSFADPGTPDGTCAFYNTVVDGG